MTNNAMIVVEKPTNNAIATRVGEILPSLHWGHCILYFELHMKSEKNKLHSLKLNNGKFVGPKG